MVVSTFKYRILGNVYEGKKPSNHHVWQALVRVFCRMIFKTTYLGISMLILEVKNEIYYVFYPLCIYFRVFHHFYKNICVNMSFCRMILQSRRFRGHFGQLEGKFGFLMKIYTLCTLFDLIRLFTWTIAQILCSWVNVARRQREFAPEPEHSGSGSGGHIRALQHKVPLCILFWGNMGILVVFLEVVKKS